ncbi:MAG TPA: nucleotidyltransferase family protein [Terriglobales bacterium]|nr:nucleotidyltransferase family protein [Terriglobales bacterium]
MNRAPSFCAVILAAGESTRMGRDKALLAWPPNGNETFLQAGIRSLQDFNDLVIVVVGKNESALAPLIYGAGATLVRNYEPERGQFSSLQTGLQEVLNRGRDAAMVTLVDRPPVTNSTLQILRENFDGALADGKWAVIPEHEGKHGHPMLIDREMIEAFLKAPLAASARDIKHQFQSRIAYIPVDDPNVALNVNTPEDYAALRLDG